MGEVLEVIGRLLPLLSIPLSMYITSMDQLPLGVIMSRRRQRYSKVPTATSAAMARKLDRLWAVAVVVATGVLLLAGGGVVALLYWESWGPWAPSTPSSSPPPVSESVPEAAFFLDIGHYNMAKTIYPWLAAPKYLTSSIATITS